MDRETAHMLNELNKCFYESNAESFSKTRANPWKGWDRLSPHFENATTVLDVACGNLRFERFVHERCPLPSRKFYCVDSCLELVGAVPEVAFQHLDVVGLCIEGNGLAKRLDAPSCDFVASFGFFHHVPGVDARHRLLRALVEKTVSGGRLALSFWQFMNDARIASKAVETTARQKAELGIDLDKGDYLLGWQDASGTCRYCHHFEDGEIDALIASLGCSVEVIERYSADGKAAPLNSYVVLQKREDATADQKMQ